MQSQSEILGFDTRNFASNVGVQPNTNKNIFGGLTDVLSSVGGLFDGALDIYTGSKDKIDALKSIDDDTVQDVRAETKIVQSSSLVGNGIFAKDDKTSTILITSALVVVALLAVKLVSK